MSGELADCFATKLEGVQFILNAFVRAVDQRHARVYRNDGKVVTPQIALQEPLKCAATNWHALAKFAGRFAQSGPSLLIDIGSTTCDIVPLANGQPAPRGMTDTLRLMCGELVYTGVGRSPVCAVVQSLPFRGQRCPVAQELFATTLDAYLMLGDVPEEPSNNVTADGRPATRSHARGRLARMLCADAHEVREDEAVVMAREIASAQLTMVTQALAYVLSNQPQRPQQVLVVGQGEFLARRAMEQTKLQCPVISLADRLGPMVSRCAPAHALAVLASEA
jgi:probable H4MPT-linked C1 transfer pathway protein